MSIDLDQLAAACKVKNNDSTAQRLADTLDVATTVVSELVEVAWRPVPAPLEDRALLAVGREVWRLEDTPSTSGQYAVPDAGGVPARRARDPREAAMALLSPYVARGL